MKVPKAVKRYCKKCKKSTTHKVVLVKSGTKRGSLKKGSIQRAKKRGRGVGAGNKGRWGSKPTKPKRTGIKGSKKLNLKLTCSVCSKSSLRIGSRAKKIELK